MAKKQDNKFIDWVCDKLGLSDDQRELLHERITRQRLSKKEILEAAEEIKTDFPNK